MSPPLAHPTEITAIADTAAKSLEGTALRLNPISVCTSTARWSNPRAGKARAGWGPR
jgi:hypothetical protein